MTDTDKDRQRVELNALEVDLKPTTESENESVSSAQLCKELIGATAEILAPNWMIQEKEVEILGDAYGAVLDKYLPTMQGTWGPEVTAVVLTITMIGPRWHLPRKAGMVDAGTPTPQTKKEDKKKPPTAPAPRTFAEPIEGESSHE